MANPMLESWCSGLEISFFIDSPAGSKKEKFGRQILATSSKNWLPALNFWVHRWPMSHNFEPWSSILTAPKQCRHGGVWNLFFFTSLEEPVPDYKPPFEAELGPSITSEHIREYVARQKRRPGFPDVWKNNHPVGSLSWMLCKLSFSIPTLLSCIAIVFKTSIWN